MDFQTVEAQPWQSLASGLGFSSPDEEYWWFAFAQPLNRLMEWANYSIAEQYRVLAFLHRYVIPTCGPRPNQDGEQYWKTFLNYDHTPIQVSLNFYDSKATVRTCYTPICGLSGSTLDPLNQKASIDTLNAQKHLVPGHDLRWFEHFTKAFFLSNDEANLINAQVSDRTLAMLAIQCALSYDFPYHGTQTKVAICPVWKHVQTGRPKEDLIFEAIKDLGSEAVSYMQSLEVIMDFANSGAAAKAGVTAACFAFDTNLNDTYQSSRIKIYFAIPHTSFNRVVETYTLGGRLNGPETERAIQALRLLWSSVMNVPEGWNDDTEIPCGDPHLRGNVVFNFEIWPGALLPIPKVYLSVAYYGKPDLKIAEGMDVFFQTQGWKQPFHSYKSNYLKAFVEDEKVTCRHHDISFSHKKGSAYITVYFKPELDVLANPATWSPKFFK